MAKTVLITGASGFLGRNLIEQRDRLFPNRDTEVCGTFLNDTSFPALAERNRVIPWCVDLSHADPVFPLTEVDLCIHLAAQVNPTLSKTDQSTDLKCGPLSLINLCSSLSSIGRLIFFSSGAVYEGQSGKADQRLPLNPLLPYAISKLAAERYARWYRRCGVVKQLTVIRFFGLYGPWEPKRKIYRSLIERGLDNNNDPVYLTGSGMNLVDAMYADDAVEAVRCVVDSPLSDVTVDLCAGRPTSVHGLAKDILHAYFGHLDQDFIFGGKATEFNQFYGDPDPMLRLFHFQPYFSLEAGISRYLKWMKEHPDA